MYIAKAQEFAKKAHQGQMRKFSGGSYYEEHCVVVADYVHDNLHQLFPSSSWKGWFLPETIESVLCAAYLHDVIEDTKYTADDLYTAGFSKMTVGIVETLTKKPGMNYFDYIMSIMDSGAHCVACRAIKLADLECNMKSLNEGSMKDKYRFAKYILSQGLD